MSEITIRLDAPDFETDTSNHQLAIILSARVWCGTAPLGWILSLTVQTLGGEAHCTLDDDEALEFMECMGEEDAEHLARRACVVWVEPISGSPVVRIVRGLR